MPREFIKLPPWKGLPGAGGAATTATLELPVGRVRYHKLQFKLSNGAGNKTMADFANIVRIKIGGRVVRSIKGSEFHYLTNLNGPYSLSQKAAGQPYYANIFFSEPWRRTADGEDSLGWGTFGLEPIFIEVDFNANLAEAPVFEGRAWVDYPTYDASNAPVPALIGQPFVIGDFSQIARHPINASAAGDLEIDRLPPRRYYRFHLMTDKADYVEIRRGNTVIWEGSKAQADEDMRTAGFTPSATVFTIMFDGTQRVRDYRNFGDGERYTVLVKHLAGVVLYDLVAEYVGRLGE